MKEYKNLYADKKIRERQRKRRVRWMKKLLPAMAVMVLILLIYIIISLCSLIARNIEHYSEGNPGNVVMQEAEDAPVQDGTSEHDAEQGYTSEYDTEQDDALKIDQTASEEEKARAKIQAFAKANNLSMRDYSEDLIESLAANPEKEEFILNYPLKKNTYSNQKLTECLQQSKMPLLLQWDDRWGYYAYGNGVIGVLGCGPTSLSMVALHLLQDAKLTPIYMADYAMQNGYYADGVGTAWDFMTDGARRLGLKVQEVPLDENIVTRHLRQGRPIICAMGPGDFTKTGHFIVLTGVEDGKIRINDCNSRSRSEKLWTFEEFKYQIKNMWVYSVP